MTAIDDYLTARAAFVDHDALVQEMVDGLNAGAAERLGDWRRVRCTNTNPPGGFPTGTTDRVIDAHAWPLGHESAEMIDAGLPVWHRLLFAMHMAWELVADAERLRVEVPPEDAD